MHRPTARELSQALLFVEVFGAAGQGSAATAPVFWRGRARVEDLRALAARFLGEAKARELFERHARELGLADVSQLQPDGRLVHRVETQLAGAIGSASARVMVASAVEEETLGLDDVMRIVDEASQLRAYSHQLEVQQASLRRATDELRAANEKLQGLDRLKDDFMSSVTHELRTPLTSIRALAELMRDEADMPEAQRQQFMGIIVGETERLSRLVNQVLDMAKIESGHADWIDDDVDLVALARHAAQTLAETLRERGVTLQLDLPTEPLPTLRADPDRLLQVLLNLLSNAAKFVPAGAGRIVLTLRGDAQGATVTVADNGPGVPAHEQALVFEKFRQGGDGLNRPQGTGLGLPICRQIVEHYGGRIWLQSDPGQGATFGYTLPWTHAAAGGMVPAMTTMQETAHEPQDTDRR